MTHQNQSNTLLDLSKIKVLQNELNDRILKRLNKSVVFADGPFMEWFNLTVGIDTLISKAGVHNLKEFSSLENGEQNVKAVFLLSQPLRGVVIETLKDILISSKFQFVLIVTNLDPSVYDETPDHFDSITDKCLFWMSNANYTCEIVLEKFPFVFLPQQINGNEDDNSAMLFLNPLCSWSNVDYSNHVTNIDTYQRLVKQEMIELHSSGSGSTANKDDIQHYYTYLGKNEKENLKAISNSIVEMIECLDARVDCFTMGVLSTILAHEINITSTNRLKKKNNPNKVSLLLIDRNLDLSVTSLFHEETVFDKISNLLPNLNSISNDFKIDLRNFLFENKCKNLPHGNLFHFSSDPCKLLIDQYLYAKPKECMLDVYRKLNEIFPPNDSAKDKKATRINSDLMKNQLRNGIKNNEKAFIDNIDLIQIISAYCQINDPQSTRHVEYDKLISYVKVLTQNILNKDGSSVLSRLYALFSEKFEKNDKSINYSLSDLLILLIYVYSLIGEECYYGTEEEDRIKKLLVNEFQSENFLNDFRLKSDSDLFNKIKNCNKSQFVDKLFHNLKQLKFFRKNLKNYSKLLIKDDEKDQYYYKPLIKQVVENLIKANSNQSEQLMDIEYRAPNGEGFNLFKSFKIGFMNSSNKIHPLNNDLTIIYIVGGITSYEFKLVKDLLREHEPGKNILIGSSHFCNHSKLMNYLLN